MNNPNVRVGIGVFVIKDGKFIMQQRAGSHGSGTWSVPGGIERITEPEKCVAQRWNTFDSLPDNLFLPWRQLKLSEFYDALRGIFKLYA